LARPTGLAAVSGYPSITVPMGDVRDLPLGMCFFGPKWSEATLIGAWLCVRAENEGADGARILPYPALVVRNLTARCA
jgi:hypothetical protein